MQVFPALQGGPHNHQIAALAVALKEAYSPSFKTYIQQVKKNAQTLASALQQWGYEIVTGGTDNHLILWDLRPTSLSGNKIEKVLEKCEISVNKNSVAGDTSAINPGGIRLGTPAMTTRGMVESDMQRIAVFLHQAVLLSQKINTLSGSTKLKDFLAVIETNHEIQLEIANLRKEVIEYASRFPLPGKKVI